ncbi:MAG: DNA-binding protein [Chlorobi bacterium]|nr:DNA-binding protein [Chlorobiota bacterium]
MTYKGNQEILNGNKTAFLCSRKVPADIVLKSYDWAKKQREQDSCVVCGNQSQIEKDVFEILLRGTQSLILVIARGMKTRWEPEIEKAVQADRLLIISPFSSAVKRVSRATAKKRNQEIIKLSDRITVGYMTQGGQLDELLAGVEVGGV